MNGNVKVAVLSLGFTVWVSFSTMVFADNQFRSLGSGDLFEKTMDDLDTIQSQAVDANQQTAQKNREFQNELLSLEDQLQSLTDTLTELKRDALRLTDEITLDDKRKKLLELRLKNLETHKDQLQDEHQRIQKRLKMTKIDNEKTQDQINQWSQEAAQSKTSGGTMKAGTTTAMLRERNAIKNQLALKQKAVVDLQAQLVLKEEQKTKVLTQKDSAQKNRSVYMDQIAVLENQLDKLQSQEKLMRREIAAKSNAPADGDALAEDIIELRSQVQELKATMARVKNLQTHIKPQTIAAIKKMEGMAKLFEEYHTLLQKRLAKLKDQSGVRPANRNTKTESQYKDLAALKKELILQNMDLQARLQAIPLPASKKQVQLESEMKAVQTRVRKLTEQWTRLKGQDASVSKLDGLSKDIRNLETQLAGLRSEAVKLQEPPPEALDPQEEAFLKESINQLLLRQSILDSSLTSINNKYKKDDVSADKIHEQEVKLSEYIKVLQNENSALQEQLLSLQMRSDKRPN